MALALVLFVQASNVYPQLLLGRLFFSIGGSAISTMVTAVLPVVTGSTEDTQAQHAALSTDSTLTPDRPPSPDVADEEDEARSVENSPSSRLAGFVGMCAGGGALVSLALFLPLPTRFQKAGLSPPQAIRYSYYVVALVAVLISTCCLFGLKNLPGEEGKGWKALWSSFKRHSHESGYEDRSYGVRKLPYWKQLNTALVLGFQNQDILLGYIGGFVARASSVGISLFIPLFVNHYYRRSGLCDNHPHPPDEISGADLGDIKKSCTGAYILASILTGVSQLIALLAAPWFGFWSAKSRRYHIPLLVAALAGIIGYLSFALIPSPQFKGPDGNGGVFILMAFIGISQIGAIVCSLAMLSNGILKITEDDSIPRESAVPTVDETIDELLSHPTEPSTNANANEQQALLSRPITPNPNLNPNPNRRQQYAQIKGSIAGVYSLYGGAGILLLTKLGGFMFDALDSGSPFYLMAAFNAILFVAVTASGVVNKARTATRASDA